MRHFIGYRADGQLGSLEVYGPGGWPRACEGCGSDCEGLATDACQMPAVASLRERRKEKNPDIIGFMAYDCPCSSALKRCEQNHCSDWMAANYIDVDTKAWVEKPSVTVEIDGVSVAHNEVVSRTPVSTATLKLIGADVPNGATVKVSTGGLVDIVVGADEFDLTFTDGETDTASLVIPGHGVKGRLFLFGKYVRPTLFYLRGWAV